MAGNPALSSSCSPAFPRKDRFVFENGEKTIFSSAGAGQGCRRGRTRDRYTGFEAVINLHSAGAHGQSQATFRAKNYEPCAVGHHVAWLNIITHPGNNFSSAILECCCLSISLPSNFPLPASCCGVEVEEYMNGQNGPCFPKRAFSLPLCWLSAPTF